MQCKRHGRAVFRDYLDVRRRGVRIQLELDRTHAACADFPLAEDLRRYPAQQVGEEQRRSQFVAHGGKRGMEAENRDLGFAGTRHDHRSGSDFADAQVGRRGFENGGLFQLEIPGAESGRQGIAGIPAREGRLLDGRADGDRRALGRWIDPDGIGSRTLGRNEAVEDHQAVIAGAVFLRLAIDRGNPWSGRENGAQHIGLVRVDGDWQHGERRQME